MAAEALQLYFESRSPTTALRTMRRRYPNDTEIGRLSPRQLYRLVARFRETESVADKRHVLRMTTPSSMAASRFKYNT